MKRKWSKKKIIEEILRLHKAGEDLNARHIIKNYPSLAHAAYKKHYFGNWENAIRAAGLDYEAIKALGKSKVNVGRKWTKEQIIDEIQKLAEKGVHLNFQYMRKHYNPLLCAACKKYNFGSWKNAIEAAGLDYDEINKYAKRKHWTKTGIIEEIKKLYNDGENLQYMKIKSKYQALCVAAAREFGNWGNAVNAAGINYDDYRAQRKPWTKEKIVNRILELYKKGEDLSHSNIQKKYNYLLMAASKPRLFNGWRYAVEAAGINYDDYYKKKPPGYWTKSRIIETIKEWYEMGKDLSISQINQTHSSFSTTASNMFGSWKNAIEAAGLDYDEINRYSDRESWTTEKILNTIIELYNSGEDLTSAYNFKFRPTLYYAVYDDPNLGSWSKAIAKAGLDYDKIRKDIKSENYKGLLLEKYVKEIFEVIGKEVDYQKRFENGKYRPDFVDKKSGEWIEVKLNSWGNGIEKSISNYLNYVDSFSIYYLSGPPRKWLHDKVKFKCVKDFFLKLKELGREDIIKDLSLLDKGVVPSRYQKDFEDYMVKTDIN